MDVIKGIPVSPGFAIGEIFLFDDREGFRVSRRFISITEIDDEFRRFTQAVQQVIGNLKQLQIDVTSYESGVELQQILGAHIMIVGDKQLQDDVWQRISKNRFSAEYAVTRALARYKDKFSKSASEYIAQRVSDVVDIEKHLLESLRGERLDNLGQLDTEVILVARDLPPSVVVGLDRSKIIGFATDTGGRTSHSAIVARAREIPAVVALGRISEVAADGYKIIVDGNRGVVVVNPDEETLGSYRQHSADYRQQRDTLLAERGSQSRTLDGTCVKILVNIEFPDEIDELVAEIHDGIGLYRTEFLYLSSKRVPTESDHYDSYKRALTNIKNRKMTVRTYDLGADKLFNLPGYSLGNSVGSRIASAEPNPALGCRAIRYCLLNPNALRPQLRAICRAAHLSPNSVQILLPMVCCREEVLRFRGLLQKEMELLEEENIEYEPNIPVGIMVEVPAVAANLDNFVDICDFFSIGTNDLTQYAMGVDRGNEQVANLYRPANIGVLRLIKQAIEVAAQNKREISICGEIAGDPLFVFLLLGIGLRSFSVAPPRVPQIRQLIRAISIPDAEIIAEEALQKKDAIEVQEYIRDALVRFCPQMVPVYN